MAHLHHCEAAVSALQGVPLAIEGGNLHPAQQATLSRTPLLRTLPLACFTHTGTDTETKEIYLDTITCLCIISLAQKRKVLDFEEESGHPGYELLSSSRLAVFPALETVIVGCCSHYSYLADFS